MWYNRIMQGILQSPLHGLISSGIMLVKYTGRKSGQRFSVPVSFTVDEEERLWTVSLRKRTWWRNLRADAKIVLRFKGKDRLARCEVLEAEADVRQGLRTLLALAPVYARYMEIPLDEAGQPDAQALENAVARRVLVRFELIDGS
jgi:deazaflavin-dependent oxidoreductase (nitroreductase family)